MTPVAETDFSITHRDMGWGEIYELRLPTGKMSVATLTIDEPGSLRFGKTPEPLINWSAIGSQTIDTASAFARGLLALAEKIPKEPA